VGRLIGFEELGNSDAFTTATLELRLGICGMSAFGIVVPKLKLSSRCRSKTTEQRYRPHL